MKAQRYRTVNATWPPDLAPPTAQEATAGAKRLVKLVTGKPFAGRVTLTSGNRRNYYSQARLVVNPDRGWPALVHDLSHYLHRYLKPGLKPHDYRHELLERTMVAYVIDRGWHTGALQRETPARLDKAALQAARHARIKVRIAKWEARQKRAVKALGKLRRQDAYYKRELNLGA